MITNISAYSETLPDARRDLARGCTHTHHSLIDCDTCQIRPLSMCSALEHDQREELAALARPVQFMPRQQILLQDEAIDSVFNVTSGVARLYRLLADGRRQVVGFVIPGDFIGLSMAETAAYCADALSPLTACRFNRALFSNYIDERPQLLRRLFEMTGHELALAQEHITIIGRRTAEERVVCFLIGMRKRWGRMNGQAVNIPLPMTRQDIADFLGLTIETVSRAISKLARERALMVVPDGVRLLEPARLEAIAVG